LHEPEHSLVKQYVALLQTENIRLTFTSDAIEEIARVAFQVNQSSQNIGARRLYTVLEHLLEELSFDAPHMSSGPFEITLEYVQQKLESVSKNEDLSKFIL
jgi:ATP-dependent HslUV protease ATP-binding subunit HslU